MSEQELVEIKRQQNLLRDTKMPWRTVIAHDLKGHGRYKNKIHSKYEDKFTPLIIPAYILNIYIFQ